MFKTEKEYREFVDRYEEFQSFAEDKWEEYMKIKWPTWDTSKCAPSARIDDGHVYVSWYGRYEEECIALPDIVFHNDNWKEIVSKQIEEEKKKKEEKEKKDKEDLLKLKEANEHETYQKLKAKFEKVV